MEFSLASCQPFGHNQHPTIYTDQVTKISAYHVTKDQKIDPRSSLCLLEMENSRNLFLLFDWSRRFLNNKIKQFNSLGNLFSVFLLDN